MKKTVREVGQIPDATSSRPVKDSGLSETFGKSFIKTQEFKELHRPGFKSLTEQFFYSLLNIPR